MQMSRVKKLIITALCIALCIVLPMAFHTIPNAGNIFTPMHIPVLLCGLTVGAPYGLLCGLTGPLLSSILTSMPPAAVLPSMMLECAVYGTVTGLCIRRVHTKSTYADLYISMIAALLLGRIVGGIAKALIFNVGDYGAVMWITGYFITCLPGLLLQLLMIPSIVFALLKAGLVQRL